MMTDATRPTFPDPQPIFPHDCTACEFLGTTRASLMDPFSDKWLDWYICTQRVMEPLGPSVIARYGVDGDYWSMPLVMLTNPGKQTSIHELAVAMAGTWERGR